MSATWNEAKKREYMALVDQSYEKGVKAALDDAAKRRFRKPANAASEAGITVLSAAGSAFIRGYLDNYPSVLPAAD